MLSGATAGSAELQFAAYVAVIGVPYRAVFLEKMGKPTGQCHSGDGQDVDMLGVTYGQVMVTTQTGKQSEPVHGEKFVLGRSQIGCKQFWSGNG